MRKLLLTTTALLALAVIPANAVESLSIGVLAVAVPQSASEPCIICATQQAHNPANFGFNNFISTGQTAGGNFFSTNLVGGSLASGDEIDAVPYTAGQLITALADHVSFGVAIDVNSAEHAPAMTLDLFQLIRVDASNQTLSIIANFTGPFAMPDIRPGNGKGDYVLTGFDLSSLNLGDRLIFRAQFSGGTDGGESFYLVAQPQVAAIPEASTWAMMLLGFAGIGLFAMRKRRGKNEEAILRP
jgi:PEP-CTERM motif